MRPYLGTVVLCTALVSGMMISGCAARVYDYQDHDYHRWNGQERAYYQNWENETHRRHLDYDRRDQPEQREYWQWRDSHYGDQHHGGHRHGRPQ